MSNITISSFIKKSIPFGLELSYIVREMNFNLYGVSQPPLYIRMQYGTFKEGAISYEVFIDATENEFIVFFTKNNKRVYLLECEIPEVGNILVKGGSLAGFLGG